MPVVNIEGIGPISFPDEMSNQEIERAIEKDILPSLSGEKQDTGFTGATKASYQRLKGDIAALAGRAGLMDVEEAQKYKEAQEAKAERIFKPTEEGWTEAPFTKFKETLGGSLPYVAAPVIAGVGATTLGAPAAVATGAGALASALQFTGSNLSRQMQEGKQLKDTDLMAAGAAAIPQAALDTLSLRMMPGVGRVFGAAGKQLPKETLKNIAEQGILKTVGSYALQTGKTASIEGATEAAQQFFERLQAGLDIADEKARDEYFDSFIGGAVLGGTFAVPGTYLNRIKQRREYAEAQAKAEEENKPQPLMLGYDPTAGQEPLYVFPDGSVSLSAEKLIAPTEMPKGITEAFAKPEDKAAIEAARAAEARKGSAAYAKLDALVEKAKSAQLAQEEKKAATSPFNPIVTDATLAGMGIGRSAKLRTSGALEGKDLSQPEQAAEVRNVLNEYKKTVSPAIQAKVDDFLTRPEFQFEAKTTEPATPDTVAFIPRGAAEVKTYDGQVIKKDDGYYIQYKSDGKTVEKKIDPEKVLVNPTPDDIEMMGLLKEYNKIKSEPDDFRKFLMEVGINPKEKADVGGEDLRVSPYFRTEGQNVDQIASSARDRGLFMSTGDDVEDVQIIRDMIAEALAGERTGTSGAENQAKMQSIDRRITELKESGNVASEEELANYMREEAGVKEAEAALPAYEEEYNQFMTDNEARINEDLAKLKANFDDYKSLSPERRALLQEGLDAINDKYHTEFEARQPKPKAEAKFAATEKFLADGEKLAKDLRAALDKMGLKQVGLNLEDSIYQLINGKMTEVNGNYFKKLIQVSLSGDNMLRTLNHEAIHAMKDLGFFSNADWKMLTDAANKTWVEKYDIAGRYPDLNADERVEEAIADAFADRQSEAPKTLLAKMVDMLKRIGNIFRGKGFRTVDSIFAKAAEGKFKPTKEVAEAKTEETNKFKRWFGSSAIVDKNGDPLVMYHGTKEDIDTFKPNSKGLIFVTDNPETAYFFSSTKEKVGGQNILPVYVRAVNPFDYENEAHVADLVKNMPTGEWGQPLLKSAYIKRGSWEDLELPSVIKTIKDIGYDGMYVKEGKDKNLAVFSPNQIKSAIGNVGEYSLTDADLRAERPKAEIPKKEQLKRQLKDVDQRFADLLTDQFGKEKRTIVDKVNDLKPNLFERIIQGVFDEFRAIKKYSEKAYMESVLSKSTDGALEGLLFYGQVGLKDGALVIKTGTKGLVDILKPLGTEVDRYQMWKALSRDAKMPTEKRSFSDDLVKNRDQLLIGNVDGKPRKQIYEQARKEEQELNKSVLDVARQQGLIDNEAYKVFSEDAFYIPFYKYMEEDNSVMAINAASKLTGQYFSKKLKGGEKKTNDLMENVLMNWSHILSASMKNKAALDTLNAASELGGAERVKSTYEGKDVVKVMENGKTAYYAVTDPLLLDSVSLISYVGPKSPFLDVAKGFTNMLRVGVTMSPAYKVRNLVRDTVQAASVSELSLNVIDNISRGLQLSNRGNPTFIQALAGGGVFEMGAAHEGDQAKMIKRLIKQGVDIGTILDTPDKIKSGLRKAFDWYNEQGNRFENANRLALYDKLIKEGKTHLEASFAARDLMNFSSQGSFRAIKIVSQVVPFFNARLQGLYKLGRDGITPTYRVLYNTLTGEEIKASDRKKAMQFSVVSSAVMMASVMLYMAFKDDEDFKRREAWDRDNFWWFKAGDTIFRIPKPFEIGALGTLAERITEQIQDESVEGKVFFDRLRAILTDTFAMNPVPQAFKPMIDLYANKDSFTGAPIESAGLENLSKQERYTDSTSGIAKALGGISEAAAKVLTFNPDAQGFSPVQMDYAIKAYLGWIGSTSVAVADKAMQPWSDVEKPSKSALDLIGVTSFVKQAPETQSKYVTNFYESSERVNQAFADMKRFAEHNEMAKVEEILKDKGDLIALKKVYDATNKQLAQYRKYIQVVTNDRTMKLEDKEDEIKRTKVLMSETARQVEEMRIALKKQ